MKIYTKTGDAGMTSLGNGNRELKNHKCIIVLGLIDEVNATIGIAKSFCDKKSFFPILTQIQNDLLDIGAELSFAVNNKITHQHIKNLENIIDDYQGKLEPLKLFILPGGNHLSSFLHLARTTTRRAEVALVDFVFSTSQKMNTDFKALQYLNRLSDCLFVLSRYANECTQL